MKITKNSDFLLTVSLATIFLLQLLSVYIFNNQYFSLKLEILTSVIILLMGITFLILEFIKYSTNNIHKQEQQISKNLSYDDQPKAHRQLDENEKKTLFKTSELYDKHISILWITIPLAIILNIGIVGILIINPTMSVGYSIFIYLILILEFKTVRMISRSKNAYIDLTSPVFIVRGKAVQKNHFFTNKIFVKHLGFEGEFLPEIKTGDEIEIEYSPFTKAVWRFTKNVISK